MLRLSLRWKRSLTLAALVVCLMFAHTADAFNEEQQQQQQQQHQQQRQQQRQQRQQQREHEIDTILDNTIKRNEYRNNPISQRQSQQPLQMSGIISGSLPQIERDAALNKRQSGRQRELGHGHLQSQNLHSRYSSLRQRQQQRHTAARQQRRLQTHVQQPAYPSSRHSKRQSTKPEHHKCTPNHRKHNTHGKHRDYKEQNGCTNGSHSSIKTARRRSFRKATFHKNGGMYMLAHQDWYTQYRRQRGSKGVMRKLTLENTRRRKAMISLLPSSYSGFNNRLSGGSGGGDDRSPGFSNGYKSVRDGSGSGSKEINPEGDLTGEGKEADNDDEGINLRGAGSDVPDTAMGTIQAVRRPTLMGVPEPVPYQHRGLIPKARSPGSRLSPWLQLAMSMVVTSLFLTYR